MLAESALKNLPPELQFLIFNGLSIPILGVLRCVCKKFSSSYWLKNLLETHKDHARIRFEKVVYTAKPFFPERIINRTISEDLNLIGNVFNGNWKCIYIAEKIVGGFCIIHEEKIAYWGINCHLPKKWRNFFINLSYKRIHHGVVLQKHFIKTIYPFMKDDDNYERICWRQRPRERQITESNYVNYAEAETQFWAVFDIIHRWAPEDFFASTRMFFN